MVYERPKGATRADYAASRSFMAKVAAALPDWHAVADDNYNNRYFCDFFAVKPDGIWHLEVKEKRQPLSSRWPLPDGFHTTDQLVVIDEIAVRRAMGLGRWVWFLINDVPGRTIYLAHFLEIVCAERKMVMRGDRGKWVVPTARFEPVTLSTLRQRLIERRQEDEALWEQSGTLWPSPQV
jgi:hypothetical protein